MTESRGNRGAEPGWYADPAGSPRQRWWDGAKWTDHLHDPSLEVYGVTAKPVVGPQTPVYNVFIWVYVALPILSVLALATWDLRGYLDWSLSRAYSPLLDPAYFLIMLLGVAIYLGSASLAFFDWRKLNRDGFVRPFHWAWTFLSSGVYVIGRSVIVKRRADRGLAPIWMWAVITLAALVVVVVKIVDMVSVMMSILPTNL